MSEKIINFIAFLCLVYTITTMFYIGSAIKLQKQNETIIANQILINDNQLILKEKIEAFHPYHKSKEEIKRKMHNIVAEEG